MLRTVFGVPTAARGRSGVLHTVFGVLTAARGRSDVMRAQPEVVQTHGLPYLSIITSHYY